MRTFRTVDGEKLAHNDLVKLSRHSKNVYRYRENRQTLAKVTGGQTVKLDTIRQAGTLAVVKLSPAEQKRFENKI